ncbi:hypothetical protein SLE2022_066610 [Rubroshorea leprosula]
MDTPKKNPPSSKECVFEVGNLNEVLKPNGFAEISSGLQSIQTNSLESRRVALGSRVPAVTSANYQRPVQGRLYSQQIIPQQNQDQYLNPKNYQQTALSVSPHKVFQQSQQTFINPTLKAAQWFLPLEHQQQLLGCKPDSIDRQANQLPGKQSNAADLEKQKRFLNQNDMCQNFQQHSQGNPSNHSSTLPQQLCQRSNVSGLQEYQKSLGMGWRSSSSQNVFLGLGQKWQTSSASLVTQLPQSQPQPPEHVSMSQSQSQLTKLQHLSSPSLEDTQLKFLTSGPLYQVDEGRQIIGNNLKELVYQKATSLRRKYLPILTELSRRLDPILCELAHVGRPTRLLDKGSALMQIIEKAQFALNVPSNITPEYVQILNSLEKNIECIYNSYSTLMNSLTQVQLSPNVHSVQQSLQPQSQSPHIQHMQYKRQVLHPQHAEVFEMPQRNMTEVNDMKESSGICSKIPHHQTNEVKESKIRQSMGAGPFLHNRIESQRSEFHYQHLKSGVSSSIASQKVYQPALSQIPNHASQLTEINNPARIGISFGSANSPSFASCSLKPLSPLLGDSRKSIHDVSFMNAGSVECKQKINSLETASPCVASSPGVSPSPLLTECSHVAENCPDASLMTTDNLNVADQPLQHLVRLVNSISDKALSASVHDIQEIASITDKMSDSVPITPSKCKVGQDSAVMARSCIYNAKTWTIKRKIDALSLSTDSFAGSCIRINEFGQINGMDKSELESGAINCIKRPRIEANHMLNKEIREINQRLIDTVVDITDEDTSLIETAAATEFNEAGTVVRCSFSAVAISPHLKSLETSILMTLIKPLRLLVPANYPACSPILLDKILAEMSEEHGDLSVRVQSKLNRSLRRFPQPMSLLEIARAWGKCARAVICEYAEQHGGGSFSSKYGPWENCLTAARTEKEW